MITLQINFDGLDSKIDTAIEHRGYDIIDWKRFLYTLSIL